ncbi:hypothetical protein ACJPQX_05785 [Vibrio vulnificus]|uniref:hypothetical protein n=1 Tax=Vibrio vulnificus TaxID=672 RepID=UPI003D9C97A4
MKKLFNASLVALAVAGTFGAQAATISSTPAQLSAEGIAIGNIYTGDITFDVVVSKEHASSSEIVLSFGDNVDFATNNLAGGACGAWAVGQATCGDVSFDVGTGSFTFDNVVVDSANKTITFDVNLGNAMTANSAFRVTVGAVNDPILEGAANVNYASNLGGTEIETGVGKIAETAQQFSFVVNNEFDGKIERINQTTFVPAGNDILNYTLTNNTALLAKVTGEDATITFSGNFANVVAGDFANTTTIAPVVSAGEDLLTVTVPSATVDLGDYAGILEFDPSGAVIPQTGDIKAGASLAGTTPVTAIASNVAAGEWSLDASVVNVPYLPLGFENIASNVEYSNHGSAVAAVSITAFDSKGNTYTGDLANAPGKTVTKYSDAAIMAALGITEPTKLNITFISDADADDVSIVPYYRQGDARVQTINDQYKK